MLLIWGVVTGRYYRYYAFGGTESENVSLNQEYKYTGKPMDDEFDLDIYYYGARYYQPSLGRWIAVDPLHGKYPGWSPYAYSANNPIVFLDPNGREIVFVGKFENEKMQNLYYDAVNYWKEKTPFGKVFDRLQNSKKKVYISFVWNPPDQQTTPTTTGHVLLEWNPFFSLKTTSGGLQSPALQLLHEAAHADLYLGNPELSEKRSEKDSDPIYDTKEDRVVITQTETPAAKMTRQGTRNDHKAVDWIPAQSVTSILVPKDRGQWQAKCRALLD